ncbi:Aldo/keto reductase [Vararia minispora EC-137]|uniref:Aldo/keto reductase n=1 Tax=Vararia minispora EC-137 TaxID=1314806 RepID=A0ACB8QN87_9AGAM|nr:Aldo/keto reductase [Vararia minispora EC-137]
MCYLIQDAENGTLLALKLGFSHLDSAPIYENEASVGKAISSSGVPRERLYVTTKYDGGDIEAELRKSLADLGLDYVDLYLHHHPKLSEGGDHAKAWKEFEKVQEKGLAKSIGVSNFGVADMEAIFASKPKILPAVNQIRLHPYNYAESKPLLDLCASHNIVIEAFRILYPLTRAPGGAVDVVIEKVAQRIGGTPAQVLFKWALARRVVVVTTSENEDRLVQYLNTFSLADLTSEEIDEIDAAGAKGSPPESNLGPVATEQVAAIAARLGIQRF